MVGVGLEKHRKKCRWEFIISWLITCIFVLISQFSLIIVPRYFSTFSLAAQLSISALLLLFTSGLGNNCRRVLHFYASAPAFVFFNVLFIWGVHVTVIQKGIFLPWSILFNIECTFLLLGLCRIVYSDPGMIPNEDASLNELIHSEVTGLESYAKEEGHLKQEACFEQAAVKMEESSLSTRRVRYCKYCNANIKGFDHHCPAFGNCIGERNHLIFMALLVGFITVETSYIVSSTQSNTKSLILEKAMVESNLSAYLAISTNLFSVLQVIWQVLFLVWHIYCVCVNITTDEWINWNKYPEFQHFGHPEPGKSDLEPRFRNPYDKGVLRNIKEFLSRNG